MVAERVSNKKPKAQDIMSLHSPISPRQYHNCVFFFPGGHIAISLLLNLARGPPIGNPWSRRCGIKFKVMTTDFPIIKWMNRYYFVQNFSKMVLLTLTLQQEGGNFHREGLEGGGYHEPMLHCVQTNFEFSIGKLICINIEKD